MHTGPETRTGTTIPPVPAHTVRILHTSDWQLGMKRWFLGDEAGPRYQEARLAVIERILDLAVENSCTAVVVAGDVFDDNLVDDRTWRRAVDVLRRSPVPVFLLPGNHDPYDPASIYRDPVFDSLRPTVQVLTDSASHVVATVPDDAPVLEVIGAPLLSRYMESDTVAAALREIRDRDAPSDATVPGDRARVRVLVGHGATRSRTSGEDPAVIDVDGAAEACRRRTVDYVALGDTHSAVQLSPDNTVWYSGSPEPTDFREEDGGGESRSGFVLVVDVTVDPDDPGAPAEVAVCEVPVGTWHFLALSAGVDSREEVGEWISRLESLPDKRTTVVKYALTGTVDLETGALLDRETARVAPTFAALYPRERLMDLHTVPGEGELSDIDLPGAVGAAARTLAEMTTSGDSTARDALRLLYRLSADRTSEVRGEQGGTDSADTPGTGGVTC
ncbi:Nuclease SbcCD subunit D [Corynebacterium provencense]|uniref:Nuclease SbcCD subunit D n=1 Tax=Corynebacterium provencense TaxID=1737425 RepID=A0A2Z3YT88_9CORY|nr:MULTISPECIES: DNA repair exonuclease [Corynebacterium]AWT25824.1 Nuclease SbcCD subunit D [Corynebacterium provencense]